MLTADTITDEQIRELRELVIAETERAGEAGAAVNARELLADCNDALDIDDEDLKLEYRRDARARCAEILNAREPHCDFRDAHDALNDIPAGNSCDKPATHRIEWADGRYSFGCDAHLMIDESASVKPARVVPLPTTRTSEGE